jgi:hypothetical protein
MPARTQPQTAPAPESTAAPAETPVQDPVTTPPMREQAAPADPAPIPEERIDIPPAPAQATAAELPPYLLPLSAAGIVLSGLALLMGITVYLQLRRSHNKLNKQVNDLKGELNALAGELTSLRGSASTAPEAAEPQWRDWVSPVQPGGLEWAAEINRTAAAVEAAKTQPEPPRPAPPVSEQPISNQILISRPMLIQALNNGDRQAVREHTTAQLNITSDSENALAMGRSQRTQLETVSVGGSYWLAVIGDQAWLFPTELTLRGFLSVQPNKGLYSYEKQIISSPQLIEPALLRQEGNLWAVETLGRVAIP